MTTVVRIDPTLCRGHAICALHFAEGVELDRWGFARVVDPTLGTERAVRRARRAAAACPNGAVAIVERGEPVPVPVRVPVVVAVAEPARGRCRCRGRPGRPCPRPCRSPVTTRGIPSLGSLVHDGAAARPGRGGPAYPTSARSRAMPTDERMNTNRAGRPWWVAPIVGAAFGAGIIAVAAQGSLAAGHVALPAGPRLTAPATAQHPAQDPILSSGPSPTSTAPAPTVVTAGSGTVVDPVHPVVTQSAVQSGPSGAAAGAATVVSASSTASVSEVSGGTPAPAVPTSSGSAPASAGSTAGGSDGGTTQTTGPPTSTTTTTTKPPPPPTTTTTTKPNREPGDT